MTSGYKALGISEEFTECQCCGKPNLKKTVALQWLDEDGNEDGPVLYFGTTCATRAVLKKTGKTVKASDITREALQEAYRLRQIEIVKRLKDSPVNPYVLYQAGRILHHFTSFKGPSEVAFVYKTSEGLYDAYSSLVNNEGWEYVGRYVKESSNAPKVLGVISESDWLSLGRKALEFREQIEREVK